MTAKSLERTGRGEADLGAEEFQEALDSEVAKRLGEEDAALLDATEKKTAQQAKKENPESENNTTEDETKASSLDHQTGGEACVAPSQVDLRIKFVDNLLCAGVQFVVQPGSDEGIAKLSEALRKTPLLASESVYGKICRDGAQRHAWIFDPASDAETPASGDARRGGWSGPPLFDKAYAERFFKAAALLRSDEYAHAHVAPATMGSSDVQAADIKKAAAAENMVHDSMHIIYKQGAGTRGKQSRRSIHELVVAFLSKPVHPVSSKKRRHYQATTSTVDCILHADVRDGKADPNPVSLATKVSILSETGLLGCEKDQQACGSDVLTQLFHQEKVPTLWEDILEHYGISTLVTATPGSGAMLRAALAMKIPAVAMCKNQAHKDFLETSLKAWLLRQTKSRTSWCSMSDTQLKREEAGPGAQEADHEEEDLDLEGDEEEEDGGEEEHDQNEEHEEEEVCDEEEEAEEEASQAHEAKQNKGNGGQHDDEVEEDDVEDADDSDGSIIMKKTKQTKENKSTSIKTKKSNNSSATRNKAKSKPKAVASPKKKKAATVLKKAFAAPKKQEKAEPPKKAAPLKKEKATQPNKQKKKEVHAAGEAERGSKRRLQAKVGGLTGALKCGTSGNGFLQSLRV